MLHRTEQEETSSTAAPVVAHSQPLKTANQDDPLATQTIAETAPWNTCIEKGIERNKRRTKIVRWGNRVHYVAVLGLMWAFAVSLKTHLHALFPVIIMFYMNFLVNMVNEGIRKYWSHVQRPAERAAARQLAAMEDPALIGPLIDALYWTDEEALQDQLRRTLARLLPHLTEDQARGLGKERHGILTVWMKTWDLPNAEREPTLLLEILHVLTAVGREKVETESRRGSKALVALLPILKPWTLGKKAGKDPTVRKAAIACREAILHKKATGRPEEQLLRASILPVAGSENLLHPVQGAPPTAPNELLRPGSQETSEKDSGG